MNDDDKTMGLVEFLELFTLPGEPEAPVTLEGKAWDEALGMEVPSGEMLTWTPRHPPLPVRQVVPGVNPPPILGELQVTTSWHIKSEKCVFDRYRHPGEEVEPEFVVDEEGVRAILPSVAEMDELHLYLEERMALLEAGQACHLTWPVSMNEVRAWAGMMGLEVAGIDEDERFSTGEGAPSTRTPSVAVGAR